MKQMPFRTVGRGRLSSKVTFFGISRFETFPQLLQETEHFCRWQQEKVAKIVPSAPPFLLKDLPSPSINLPLRQLNGSNSARQLIGSNFLKVKLS
jgi:hypothetical protein